MSRPNSQYYLSPDQQDLLMTALNSNSAPRSQSTKASSSSHTTQNSDSMANTSAGLYQSPLEETPPSGQMGYVDESPYLDFDGEFDDSYNFDLTGPQMIGDLPHATHSNSGSSGDSTDDLHDKRKSLDGKDDDDEGGGKRREGEDKTATAKKPGRKPLTSEPTSKRKAQNRAAQRAFRDRKEKHLKDLETKVVDLEKESEATNHENGLLRAQVDRLQVELKEYRKRLSWASNSGPVRTSNSPSHTNNSSTQNKSVGKGNNFQFEFPRFGDLPSNITNTGSIAPKFGQSSVPNRSTSLPSASSQSPKANGVNGARPESTTSSYGSTGNSPQALQKASPAGQQGPQDKSTGYNNFDGLFSPSILAASRNYEHFPQAGAGMGGKPRSSTDSQVPALYNQSSASNTDSPGSSESQRGAASSNGTSPEPSLTSPATSKPNDFGLSTINEGDQNWSNQAFSTDLQTGHDFNWFVQQNGGSFDPVLFGDYRDPQEAVIQQDFGSFFDDAFPLPDLGSPLHNFNEATNPSVPPKTNLMKQVDAVQNGEDMVPQGDQEQRSKMLTCNKIWDRLQSMEKFRNGEIDVDNLCSELRAKARCSEGGAVVEKKDVDRILGTAQ